MIKFIFSIFIMFFSVSSLAKNNKRSSLDRLPASITNIENPQTLYLLLYAIYLSGGNVRMEKNQDSTEVTITAGDSASIPLSCKSKRVKNMVGAVTATYTCKLGSD